MKTLFVFKSCLVNFLKRRIMRFGKKKYNQFEESRIMKFLHNIKHGIRINIYYLKFYFTLEIKICHSAGLVRRNMAVNYITQHKIY